eukprot:9359458-Pyramimonas_sp.AAC.2
MRVGDSPTTTRQSSLYCTVFYSISGSPIGSPFEVEIGNSTGIYIPWRYPRLRWKCCTLSPVEQEVKQEERSWCNLITITPTGRGG